MLGNRIYRTSNQRRIVADFSIPRRLQELPEPQQWIKETGDKHSPPSPPRKRKRRGAQEDQQPDEQFDRTRKRVSTVQSDLGFERSRVDSRYADIHSDNAKATLLRKQKERAETSKGRLCAEIKVLKLECQRLEAEVNEAKAEVELCRIREYHEGKTNETLRGYIQHMALHMSTIRGLDHKTRNRNSLLSQKPRKIIRGTRFST